MLYCASFGHVRKISLSVSGKMVMILFMQSACSFFQALASDPLAKVDKEKTDILMYCTGGIRCDVYSTILR